MAIAENSRFSITAELFGSAAGRPPSATLLKSRFDGFLHVAVHDYYTRIIFSYHRQSFQQKYGWK